MQIQGSTLSNPVRGDQRGTLATTGDLVQIVKESIIAIIETRVGERVMMPDYGIPDYVFEVIDEGFAGRLAYQLEQQIKRYEPMVESVKVVAGTVAGGSFEPGLANEQSAAVSVRFTVRGSNVPQNLVYPVWRLRAGVEEGGIDANA